MATEQTDKEPAAWKVVEANDLEYLTMGGWELQQTVVDTVRVGSHTEVLLGAPSYQGGPPTERSFTVEHFGPVTRYLLRVSRDVVLLELNTRLDAANGRAKTAEENARKATDEATEAKKDRDKANSSLASSQRYGKDQCDLAEQYRKQARKMEEDLAKVRKEIGDREFNRITGVVEKT